MVFLRGFLLAHLCQGLGEKHALARRCYRTGAKTRDPKATQEAIKRGPRADEARPKDASGRGAARFRRSESMSLGHRANEKQPYTMCT